MAVFALVVVHNSMALVRYYRGEFAQGKTNGRFLQLAPVLAALATSERPVLIDRELRFQRTTAGGNVAAVYAGLLDVLGAPTDRVDLEELLGSPSGSVVVLSNRRHDEIVDVVALEAVDVGFDLLPASPGDYGVYRITRPRP